MWPQAHFEKVKKKCKTECERHWGFTVCFDQIINGNGVLQYVSIKTYDMKSQSDTSRMRRIREARIRRFGRPPNHKAVSIKVLIQIEHFRPPAIRGPFGAVSGPPGGSIPLEICVFLNGELTLAYNSLGKRAITLLAARFHWKYVYS